MLRTFPYGVHSLSFVRFHIKKRGIFWCFIIQRGNEPYLDSFTDIVLDSFEQCVKMLKGYESDAKNKI